MVSLHGVYYAREWGFGPAFEIGIAKGLGEFAARADDERDLLLAAHVGDALVGFVAIDATGEGESTGARLRWFIVSDAARGRGVGRKLLSRALAFCDRRGYDPVSLTTFAGLDAARHLYESAGFRLVEERADDPWGQGVGLQRFERRRTAAAS